MDLVGALGQQFDHWQSMIVGLTIRAAVVLAVVAGAMFFFSFGSARVHSKAFSVLFSMLIGALVIAVAGAIASALPHG